MKNPALIKEARQFAVKLLWQALKNEPQITTDLQNTAREVFAEMVGLENKFKSEESLTRKIIVAANINSQTIEEASETVNDVLRYTFILSVENYADGFRQTIESLWRSGYYVPEKRIWNAWKNIGTKFDKGYRGINILIISSQNQRFELQFHTAESYRLKNETHNLYKEMRNKNLSAEREIELVKTMKIKAAKVKRPIGI